MMDRLSQWGSLVCCAALGTAMIQIILPDSSLKKTFQVILSAFMICCIISPFHQITGSNNQSKLKLFEKQQTEQYEQYSGISEKLFQSIACEKLEQLTLSKLSEMGIKEAKVSVYIDQSKGQLESEDIIIECTLPQSSKEKHEEICRQLEYELGTTIRVEYTADPITEGLE